MTLCQLYAKPVSYTHLYQEWGKNSDSIFRDILRCRREGIDFAEYERMSAVSYTHLLARMKARRWTTVLATACLNLILGGVIIFNPFSTAMTLLRFVGIDVYKRQDYQSGLKRSDC